MVGKILDKRYVVLEEIGSDGDGFRYLVYDMNSMNRTHIRVDPDEEGQLSGKRFTLVSADVPLAKAKADSPNGEPAKAAQPPIPGWSAPRPLTPGSSAPKPLPPLKASSSAPKPLPWLQTPSRGVPDKDGEARPPAPARAGTPQLAEPRPPTGVQRRPTPRGFQPTAPTADRPILLRSIKDTAEESERPERPPLPAPRPAAVLEEKPLHEALEQALARGEPERETTQPIDLVSAEELAEDSPAPAEPRKRIQTKVLEAAWFARGDQLDEEEAPTETAEHRLPSQEELERHAAELSPDEYRRYALEISPPMPPPVRIIEAFLEAKPDLLMRAVTEAPPPRTGPFDETLVSDETPLPASLPPSSSLPATAPVLRPAPERRPWPPAPVAPTSAPAPVAAPALLPPAASFLPAQPTPPPPAAVLPPAASFLPAQPTPPPPAAVLPPAASFLPAQPAPPPPTAVLPPAASFLPTSPALPPASFLPPVQVVPPLPLPAAAPLPVAFSASPISAVATHPIATDPVSRTRLVALIAGLVVGGILGGAMTCALTPRPVVAPPPAAPTCPPPPVCPTIVAPPAPQPPSPQPGPDDAAAPDETPPPAKLPTAQQGRVRRLLAAARRASKAHEWRRARQLADEVLKVQPGNQQATRIRAIAAAKSGQLR